MDFHKPSSPLIDGLVFKKKWVRLLFRGLDFFHRRNIDVSLPEPKKILLSNLGNLGDIFIAFQAIEAIQHRYPKASLGFLVSSTGKPALGIVQGIQRVHTFDHCYTLRQSTGLCKAVLQHFRSRRKLLKELRVENYDMAIDLHPFFPNGVPLLKKADIPIRIGYGSAGFRSALTHCFDWRDFGRYLGQLHLDHLNKVGVLSPKLPRTYLKTATLPKQFIVIQMQSSKKEKNWNRKGWILLIKQLNAEIILIGRGPSDREECEKVSQETGAINACDRLCISELTTVLKKATLLITVDSMSMHLAVLTQTPTLVFLAQINCPHLWILPSCEVICLNEEVEKIVATAQDTAQGNINTFRDSRFEF